MKKQLQLSTLLLILFISIPFISSATHYLGGEITWECIPGGQTDAGKYIFQMKLYRECYTIGGNAAANFGNTFYLQSNSPAGSILVTEISGWPKDISPDCNSNPNFTHLQCSGMSNGAGNMGACQEHIYRSSPIQLNGVPPSTGWMFYIASCCRNSSSNISGQQSFRLRAIMYPYGTNNVYPCFDYSPSFAEVPQSVLCAAYPHIINYHAFDYEHDSLAYEWGTPLLSSGTPLSPYITGYSYLNPLPDSVINSNNIAGTVNPKTGDISFTSYTTGAFVTSVKVTAYKTGVKVAEVWREMQIVITNCGTNTPPQLSITDVNNQPINIDTIVVYAGDNIVFNINASSNSLLPNGSQKNIEMRINGKQFGAYIPASGNNPATMSSSTGCVNPPCATLSSPIGPDNPLSNLSSVQTQFNWQTDCGHAQYTYNCCGIFNNVYRFSFMVKDDFCPVPANANRDIYIQIIKTAVPKIKTTNIHYNYTKMTADFSWKKYIDPDSSFISYDIYHSNNLNGPYTLIDSLKNRNKIVYSHNIGLSQQAYYYIKLRALSCGFIDTSMSSDTLSLNIVGIDNPEQTSFELLQNEPNPANGKTSIRYSINKSVKGQFQLFDLSGRKVFTQKIYSKPGLNKFELETSQFGEGIYFYSLSFENQQQIKKLIIIR